jgi:hypothetical protein
MWNMTYVIVILSNMTLFWGLYNGVTGISSYVWGINYLCLWGTKHTHTLKWVDLLHFHTQRFPIQCLTMYLCHTAIWLQNVFSRVITKCYAGREVAVDDIKRTIIRQRKEMLQVFAVPYSATQIYYVNSTQHSMQMWPKSGLEYVCKTVHTYIYIYIYIYIVIEKKLQKF